MRKKAISKQQVETRLQSGELGPANTKDPAQLQRKAWFYLGIYFGRRGRENKRQMKPTMLALRATPQGEEYFKRVPRLVASDKKPSRWPFRRRRWVGRENICCVRICQMPGENYKKITCSKSQAKLDCLFQRPREARSFKHGEDRVWYCNSPLVYILDSMLKLMSSWAEIQANLTNHYLRSTSLPILSDNNCEKRHIKSVTG